MYKEIGKLTGDVASKCNEPNLYRYFTILSQA